MERKSYLTGKAFRVFLGASILTALSSMLGNIVDGVIVSHLIDYNAMSATSLSKPIIQANFTFYQLIGLGASILVAKALGENAKGRVSSLFTLTIFVLLVYGLVETMIGVFCPDVIVNMVCKDAALKEYASQYIVPLLIGTPVFLAVYFLGGFTAIDGAPKLVSRAMVIDNVVNLCVDVTLIKVFGLGVMGSSIATLIGHAVAIGIMLSHYVGRESNLKVSYSSLSWILPPFKGGPGWVLLKEICSTGLPFAVASVCMTVYLFYTQSIIGNNLGKESLFIFSVMLNIMTFYNMFVSGACSTMQQLAALQIGLGDSYGHRMTVFSAFRFLNVSLGIACAFMMLFPSVVAGLFDCPDSLLSECCYAVRIYGVAFWLFCVLYLLMVNYKLLKQTSLANIISVVLNLSVIPVMWYAAVYCKPLVWWSNLIAYALVFICVLAISTTILLRHNRKTSQPMQTIPCRYRQGLPHNCTLMPLFLLPKTSKYPQMDISFDYSSEAMHSSFDELSAWLKSQQLPDSTVFKVRIIAEELMSNVTRHSEQTNKKAYADVRLLITPTAVTFSVTDDGAPFNPVDYQDKGYGLIIANGAASSINYKYQFGQNMTTAVVNIDKSLQ